MLSCLWDGAYKRTLAFNLFAISGDFPLCAMSGTSSDSVLARLRCVFPQQSTGKLECVINTQRQRAGLDTTICDEILLQKCVEHLLSGGLHIDSISVNL